jgi:hypothetical protein
VCVAWGVTRFYTQLGHDGVVLLIEASWNIRCMYTHSHLKIEFLALVL